VSGERADLLRKAVLSLPELYREALVLCDLEELSYEEASRRIGCPVGTVRSRLSRARALVASKLKSQIGCAS
jgi:RNA polymerase sigma-70 factor (ECF subfamily)